MVASALGLVAVVAFGLAVVFGPVVPVVVSALGLLGAASVLVRLVVVSVGDVPGSEVFGLVVPVVAFVPVGLVVVSGLVLVHAEVVLEVDVGVVSVAAVSEPLALTPHPHNSDNNAHYLLP